MRIAPANCGLGAWAPSQDARGIAPHCAQRLAVESATTPVSGRPSQRRWRLGGVFRRRSSARAVHAAPIDEHRPQPRVRSARRSTSPSSTASTAKARSSSRSASSLRRAFSSVLAGHIGEDRITSDADMLAANRGEVQGHLAMAGSHVLVREFHELRIVVGGIDARRHDAQASLGARRVLASSGAHAAQASEILARILKERCRLSLNLGSAQLLVCCGSPGDRRRRGWELFDGGGSARIPLHVHEVASDSAAGTCATESPPRPHRPQPVLAAALLIVVAVTTSCGGPRGLHSPTRPRRRAIAADGAYAKRSLMRSESPVGMHMCSADPYAIAYDASLGCRARRGSPLAAPFVDMFLWAGARGHEYHDKCGALGLMVWRSPAPYCTRAHGSPARPAPGLRSG